MRLDRRRRCLAGMDTLQSGIPQSIDGSYRVFKLHSMYVPISSFVPISLIFPCIVSAVVTIGIRMSITVISVSQHIVVTGNALARSLNYAQVLCLALTLLTNLSSTSIIGVKAWLVSRPFSNAFQMNDAG